MIAINYNITATNQYGVVSSNRKKIKLFFGRIFSFSLSTFLTSSIKKGLTAIHELQTSALHLSKEMLADLAKEEAKLQGQDHSKLIKVIGRVLKQNVLLNAEIENLIKEDDTNRFEELRSISSVTMESIEVQYDILNLLKKNNKKTPIETSPLALESNNRSLNSQETAAYERRTT